MTRDLMNGNWSPILEILNSAYIFFNKTNIYMSIWNIHEVENGKIVFMLKGL